MRSIPQALVEQAVAHGLDVHNYYAPGYYAEVFIPQRVAGCMLRGTSQEVNAFLALFESESLDLDDYDQLEFAMEVHHLGKLPKGVPSMAVCFPDWQFESEEHA